MGVFIRSSVTHIGATAGPVALSIYKRETNKTFSSIDYLKYSIPISINYALCAEKVKRKQNDMINIFHSPSYESKNRNFVLFCP